MVSCVSMCEFPKDDDMKELEDAPNVLYVQAICLNQLLPFLMVALLFLYHILNVLGRFGERLSLQAQGNIRAPQRELAPLMNNSPDG